LSRIRTPISSRKGQAACGTVAGKQVPAEIVTAPGDTGPYNSGDLAGADFIHTDVWVSMGEAKDVWAERIRLLAPYQVNAASYARRGTPPPSSCTACPQTTTPTPS
jgi:hypothetical protein